MRETKWDGGGGGQGRVGFITGGGKKRNIYAILDEAYCILRVSGWVGR